MNDFNDLPLFVKHTKKEHKLLADWEEAKQQHPQMLQQAADIALRAKRAGWKRWSAKGICEVLRWQTAVSTDTGLGFKVNNSHTAFLARDLMRLYPELEGFFELRRQFPRGSIGHVH